MIQWFREWRQARLERKIYEALVMLSLMDTDGPCDICEDDCEQCICGEQDCD